jgi:hypothetical protein
MKKTKNPLIALILSISLGALLAQGNGNGPGSQNGGTQPAEVIIEQGKTRKKE